MRTATRVLGFAGALALVAGTAAAQNSNNSNLNNGGDVVFIYSSPSSGASSLANPPDVNGDLYWRSHGGTNMMYDVDGLIGTAMEIDGYYESLFDTNWNTSPSFYARTHGPAVLSLAGDGNLEPGFFQNGFTSETLVLIGPSGFGNPCTIVGTLCSPSGGSCPPPGFVNGYIISLGFGATAGTGIVLPADGTAASNMATTYFVHGGMTAVGGLCGIGDYDLQDVHSQDETTADLGFGINPNGGFQGAASGPIPDALNSMAEGHETWRGNIINVIANSGTGLGVEAGDLLGGGMNGRYLSVGGGTSTLGVELRDLNTAVSFPGANLGIVGASLGLLPPGGFPALGGTLLILPDGLFNSTSGIWQAPVTSSSPIGFTTEGRMTGAQLPIPPTAAGATLHIQGAALRFATVTVDSTNKVSTQLRP